MRRALTAAALLLAGCSRSSRPAEPPEEPPRVRVAVTVDWEGAYLADENLRAIAALRDALPAIPLTHFICPAYFTKAGANVSELAARMRSAMRPGDEIGLHLHAWKSLVEAAGVKAKMSPTFLGNGKEVMVFENDDVGFEVDLDAYDSEAISKIIHKSRELLISAGFAPSASFRAGGWLGSPKVLAGVRAEGFVVDASAIPSSWLDEQAKERMVRRIDQIWPKIVPETQPYWIDTAGGVILELPDTGALADYLTEAEMKAHFASAVARLAAQAKGDVFVQVGLHQETAAEYASRLRAAIDGARAQNGDKLVFETVAACAMSAQKNVPHR